jgi:hypothetical protein
MTVAAVVVYPLSRLLTVRPRATLRSALHSPPCSTGTRVMSLLLATATKRSSDSIT